MEVVRTMLKPREGEMNYENLEDLAWNYMFISACLSEDDYNKLREKWNAEGGYKVTPWWLFVAQNAVVGINI